MSTIADRVVAVARDEVGVAEAPLGSNTGPRVLEYQGATALAGTGWPWCAAFVEWVWERAGLLDHPANPSTYWMCRIAAGRDELVDTPKVGGAIIWCGTHVGLVVGIGAGVVYTVEGNASDRVMEKTRAIAGARFINPKGLGDITEPPRIYWIDDPGAKYVVKGPWDREAYALNTKAGLSDALQRRADVLRTGDGRWVLRIGDDPRRGPFLNPVRRDEVLELLEKSLGRQLVPRSTVAPNDLTNPAAPAEGLGKTD